MSIQLTDEEIIRAIEGAGSPPWVVAGTLLYNLWEECRAIADAATAKAVREMEQLHREEYCRRRFHEEAKQVTDNLNREVERGGAMSKAVLCPVCGGSGKVIEAPSPPPTGGPLYKTCHGCGGKGWVEIGEDKPQPAGNVLRWE